MRVKYAAALAITALALAGCGGTPAASDDDPSGQQSSASAFPVTLENCGTEITLQAAPERVFLVNTDDVSLLAAVGVLDRVVARTSDPVDGVYSEEVVATLGESDLIATETGATGGSEISIETVMAAEPDLVLAPEESVDRATLAAAGIPLYSPPAYCAEAVSTGAASFDLVYDQVRAYGQIFGVSDTAEQAVTELKQQVGTDAVDRGSAVALYVPTGGGTLYPYGAPSMVTPIFAAAGLTNAYADSDERVFEVNMEDLLRRDPGTVVLLYSDGTPEAAVQNFEAVAGVAGLAAVQNDRVLALQFPFTDPPTPTSVEGVTKLKSELAGLR